MLRRRFTSSRPPTSARVTLEGPDDPGRSTSGSGRRRRGLGRRRGEGGEEALVGDRPLLLAKGTGSPGGDGEALEVVGLGGQDPGCVVEGCGGVAVGEQGGEMDPHGRIVRR